MLAWRQVNAPKVISNADANPAAPHRRAPSAPVPDNPARHRSIPRAASPINTAKAPALAKY